MEIVAVVLSAWFSFAIAHFGPKVETQLSWIAVGWRLLTVPFCRGFAGIEAFNAFMAVKSQYFLFSTGTDNPFERGVPDNNV